MGRLLTFLGVVTLLVGIAGTIISFAGPFLNLGGVLSNPVADVVNSAVEGPQAAELCEEGEHIVQIEGEETYSPDTGYGREVTIFCEDSEGNRRDVTMEFAGGLLGQAVNSLPGFLGTVGLGFCFSTLIGLGIILLVIGALVSRRRQVITVGEMPGVQVIDTRSTGYSGELPANSDDFTAKLRQLEAARKKNLISEDEYERLRKSILDNLS